MVLIPRCSTKQENKVYYVIYLWHSICDVTASEFCKTAQNDVNETFLKNLFLNILNIIIIFLFLPLSNIALAFACKDYTR